MALDLLEDFFLLLGRLGQEADKGEARRVEAGADQGREPCIAAWQR